MPLHFLNCVPSRPLSESTPRLLRVLRVGLTSGRRPALRDEGWSFEWCREAVDVHCEHKLLRRREGTTTSLREPLTAR